MTEVVDWTDASFGEGRRALKKWREDHARRSEEVLEIWEHSLSRYASSLGDELWTVLEQVVIAAVDCGRPDVSIDSISKLAKQFPKSTRVLRLRAMHHEAAGNFEEAIQIYDTLIELDETNSLARKRKIAVLLAKGERTEAIKALNEYLDTFINDSEAWMQLSELYIADGDYNKATFAFEDVLLANPNSSLNFRRLAELRYSLGGADNVEIARAYYEKALKIAENDTRSLYGLILCYNQQLAKASAAKRKELSSAGTAAADRLLAIYKDSRDDNAHSKVHVKAITALKAAFSATA